MSFDFKEAMEMAARLAEHASRDFQVPVSHATRLRLVAWLETDESDGIPLEAENWLPARLDEREFFQGIALLHRARDLEDYELMEPVAATGAEKAPPVPDSLRAVLHGMRRERAERRLGREGPECVLCGRSGVPLMARARDTPWSSHVFYCKECDLTMEDLDSWVDMLLDIQAGGKTDNGEAL